MVLGRTDEARAVARDFIAICEALAEKPSAVGIIAEYAVELGLAREALELIEAAPAGLFKDAALAQLAGDFERAAEIFAELGSAPGEADARLRAARNLIDSGRHAEGQAELRQALVFYRSVGATFFIHRAEALLAHSA
jgi:thioredoxin-like negative regulator of GroEL